MRETDAVFGRELDRHITGFNSSDPRSPYYDGPEDGADEPTLEEWLADQYDEEPGS